MNTNSHYQIATVLKRFSELGATIFERPYYDTLGIIRHGLVVQMPNERCYLIDETDLLPSLIALIKQFATEKTMCHAREEAV